jgi:hypothetical protein
MFPSPGKYNPPRLVSRGFFVDLLFKLKDNMCMNFKYLFASCFALLGVAASLFGFTSLLSQGEAYSPVSSSDASNSEQDSVATTCANTADTFAQDESQVLANQYAEGATADCLFVGCGGII